MCDNFSHLKNARLRLQNACVWHMEVKKSFDACSCFAPSSLIVFWVEMVTSESESVFAVEVIYRHVFDEMEALEKWRDMCTEAVQLLLPYLLVARLCKCGYSFET